jgi:hypothetical protein
VAGKRFRDHPLSTVTQQVRLIQGFLALRRKRAIRPNISAVSNPPWDSTTGPNALQLRRRRNLRGYMTTLAPFFYEGRRSPSATIRYGAPWMVECPLRHRRPKMLLSSDNAEPIRWKRVLARSMVKATSAILSRTDRSSVDFRDNQANSGSTLRMVQTTADQI